MMSTVYTRNLYPLQGPFELRMQMSSTASLLLVAFQNTAKVLQTTGKVQLKYYKLDP